MKKISKIILFIILLPIVGYVSTVIILLINQKKILPVESKFNNTKFAQVSNILQTKCSDCHSPQMTQYPFYYNFPIAHHLINKDIRNAQSIFVLSKDKLIGEKNFSMFDLDLLSNVVKRNSMPPRKYVFLHINCGLTEVDRQTISAWIDNQTKITN